MRTKFFQRVQLSDGGKGRLRSLPKLPSDARERLVQWFANTGTLPDGRIRTDAQNLAAETTTAVDSFMDAFSITSFVISKLGEHDDGVADFVEDLRDLDFLSDESDYQVIQEYFESLVPHIQRLHLDDRRRRTETAGAPRLDRVSIAIAMKPVYAQAFRYGEEEVLDYTPEIVDCTPVVQVDMEPSDTRQTFSFQMNEEQLNHLVSDLLAAQAQFEAAKELKSQLQFGKE